ncbi:MAG: peptide ABC transporter substrate-binding protein [Phycisphaerales bacterium]|nr:peptide ABC transporter substrate-binding protein [Phycisphaerales bacterium]
MSVRLTLTLLICSAIVGALVWTSGVTPINDLVWVGPDIFTLDPQKLSYQQDIRMEMALDETLVVREGVTAEPIPGAAREWEISADGREYRFRLRPDGKWSNGESVTAEDFRMAWMRAMLPDTAADYSGLFFVIDGARDFFFWREAQLAAFAANGGGDAQALWQQTLTRFDETVGVTAVDSLTLLVRLIQPTPFWLDQCGFAVTSPVHRATIERFSSLDARTGRYETDASWTKPGNRVSNGPYRLAAWRYKRDLLLEANEFYWNRESVQAKRVLMLPFEENNTAVLAYGAGGIDWIADVTVDYRADMAAQQRAGLRTDTHVLDAFGTDFFQFNCRPRLADGRVNPFSDRHVRRAFALAVNKQALVTQVTRMNESIAGALTPPGSIKGYTPPAGLPYDLTRAREELTTAGWSDHDGDGLVEDSAGNRFPVVDVLYTTGAVRYKNLALALREMWASALGVEVSLRSKDTKFFKEDLRTGNFMIARGGWYGDYGDPTTYLEFCRSTDGNNDRRYNDPAFDALLDQAAAERDPARRFALLQQAESKLVEEDLPLIPLCNFVQVYMYEPESLTGLTAHPRLEQYLGRVHRRDKSEPRDSSVSVTDSPEGAHQ